MLADGRCDLCRSDITCVFGHYSSMEDIEVGGRIKEVLEALATDGFPCPDEMREEARDILRIMNGD